MKPIMRTIDEGEMLPPFYGVAWYRWDSQRMVILPIPLNVVARALRACWVFMRMGGVSVASNARDAYWQGYRTAEAKHRTPPA